MRSLLKRDDERRSRIVLELPLRGDEAPEHAELRERLQEAGFVVVEEGMEVGVEFDRVGGGGGRVEVWCWWSVWRWG